MKAFVNVAVFLLFCSYSLAASDADEIVNLPTLGFKINFKQYSGYLDIGEGKHMHYWFVESQNDSSKDPLVLWLNGGPGCSSMEGLLAENGPFNVRNGSLVENPYSWNKIANVLYLESPAGVGFSYSDDGVYATDDYQVSLDNYNAIQEFLKKFPEYAKHDFYITGESYGGIYVPTLSVRVLNGVETYPINFKGFAIGNGLLSWEMNDNSMIFYAYYHGLFGYSLWQDLVLHCCDNVAEKEFCNFYNRPNTQCTEKVMEAVSVMQTNNLLNIYNIYAKCANRNDTSIRRDSPVTVAKRNLFKNLKRRVLLKENKENNLREEPPCIDSSDLEDWINRDDVRASIHIPTTVPKWVICSADVSKNYVNVYEDMTKQFDQLSGLKAMVYYGDVDMACNFMGAQWFIESLARPVISDYVAWINNGNIAGFVKEYENLKFVTIKGSGHMVPEDKPANSFAMFKKFLNDETF